MKQIKSDVILKKGPHGWEAWQTNKLLAKVSGFSEESKEEVMKHIPGYENVIESSVTTAVDADFHEGDFYKNKYGWVIIIEDIDGSYVHIREYLDTDPEKETTAQVSIPRLYEHLKNNNFTKLKNIESSKQIKSSYNSWEDFYDEGCKIGLKDYMNALDELHDEYGSFENAPKDKLSDLIQKIPDDTEEKNNFINDMYYYFDFSTILSAKQIKSSRQQANLEGYNCGHKGGGGLEDNSYDKDTQNEEWDAWRAGYSEGEHDKIHNSRQIQSRFYQNGGNKFYTLSEAAQYLSALFFDLRTIHFLCTGSEFYTYHELAQKLYEETEKFYDDLVETAIGYDSNVQPMYVLPGDWTFTPNNEDLSTYDETVPALLLNKLMKIYDVLENVQEYDSMVSSKLDGMKEFYDKEIYKLKQALK